MAAWSTRRPTNAEVVSIDEPTVDLELLALEADVGDPARIFNNLLHCCPDVERPKRDMWLI
jgi:hypothetical protein